MPVFGSIATGSIADRFHTALCSIYPPPTGPTVGADSRSTYTLGTARYTGVVCQVEPMARRTENEEGGADTVTEELAVIVGAFEAPDATAGDIVIVTVTDDQALTDRALEILRVEARTAALTRRIVCRFANTKLVPGT